MTEKFWANSGDSHFLEPEDLWDMLLPPALADRMPKSEKIGTEEIVRVDGKEIRRALLPAFYIKGKNGETTMEAAHRPPGARDMHARMIDLDNEGIWGEVIYPSLGLWHSSIEDPALVKAASAAQNEWIREAIQGVAPERLVPTALLPLLNIEDAVAEIYHAADLGLHAASLTLAAPPNMDPYSEPSWEPVWNAFEETRLVATFHVGDTLDTVKHFGPGGAILNYVATTDDAVRVAMLLVASGVLDRHPAMKILISEGGASWVPYMAERLEEACRTRAGSVYPKLKATPKEILYRQVYASFQHDASAPFAHTDMGYPNVMWGSDYPHLEGTFGHTQETLHQLFDDLEPAARDRITLGAFRELFPHVAPVPTAV